MVTDRNILFPGALLLAAALALIDGCARQPETIPRADLLPSLVDTIYADQAREALLTDLTGGWYYDDAWRDQRRGEYGYSRGEMKLVAGWQLLAPDGNRLDDQPDMCIVRPDRVERCYLNGVRETVECPPQLPGLLLTIDPKRIGDCTVRPYFDFRQLSSEAAPEYDVKSNPERNCVSVCRQDGVGGWLAVAYQEKDALVSEVRTLRLEHELSARTGRTSVSIAFSAFEVAHRSRRPLTVAFGWGATEAEAITAADSILSGREAWRASRVEWMNNVIGALEFRCDNHRIEKTFNWARLTLAGLIAERNGKKYLFTGIPYQPYPDGWHTCRSLVGVTVATGDPGLALDLLDGIIAKQNLDTASGQYGMFPGRIGLDGVEYRVPEIAGWAAQAYHELEDYLPAPDTTRSDSLAAALARNLLGTARKRLHQGLVASGASEHFMWDSPSAPDRSGATLESQFLFNEVVEFLHNYKRLELVADVPSSLLDPGGSWGTVKAAGDADMPLGFTTGTTGEFEVPLPIKVSREFFSLGRQRRSWADRLIYHEKNGKWILLPAEPDTTRFVSIPLAMINFNMRGAKQARPMLEEYGEAGYIAATGMRSLAEREFNSQPSHQYWLDEAPTGSVAWGDALLWTAGDLGKLYMEAGAWDELRILVEALVERMINTGVVGSLPEAEDGVAVDEDGNPVGSLVHCGALAGFIQLTAQGVIGLEPARGAHIRFEPKFPSDWGNYLINTSYSGGKFSVERISTTKWRVAQEGIEPAFTIELDFNREFDRTAKTVLKLLPAERLEVTFFKSGEGIWKTRTEKL